MATHHTLGNTEYWVYNDDLKLPVIVMIHGLRGTHHGLDLIAKHLNGYRVIVPDLPGFGDSKPFTNEHSIDNYVTWLRSFITDLKLSEPPVLLGHSFGSIIAASYASKYPDTISTLILENPIGAPALKGSKAIVTHIANSYYWLGKALPEPIGSRLLAAKPATMAMSITMAKTRDKKLRKFIHSQHLQHFSSYANRRVVNEAYQASISNSVRDFAPNISTRTLIIAGDRDDITPLTKQKELVKLFPNAELKVIGNVGHLTHYETPDQVAKAVINFLG